MVIKFLDVNEQFIALMEEHRKPTPGTPLIKACAESPVIFAEKMLGLRLYSWQVYAMREWMKALENREATNNKLYAVISSRQIGKTTCAAVFALWCLVFNKYPLGSANSTPIGIVSSTEDQAKRVVEDIEKWMQIGDDHMATTYVKEDKALYGKKFFTDLIDPSGANNMTTITFKKHNPSVHGTYVLAGSRIGSTFKSLPPTQKILGNTLSLILVDEAGRSEEIEDRVYYDYISPTANKANALTIFLSTPWEPVGFFYDMVDPNGDLKSSCVVIAFTIDAIRLEDPKYYAVVKAKIEDYIQKGKVDEVNRGYYCQFVKGDLSYFVPEKVREMFDDSARVFTSRLPVDVGLDFGGKTTSRTVLTFTHMDEKGIIRRIAKKVYNVQEDESLLDDLAQAHKDFNIQRIIPDNCPAGEYIIKEMVRRGWNVQPVEGQTIGMSFKTWKVKKYGAFRSYLNAGKIKSFKDPDLQTEMMAMQFNNGARNSVINHAPGYSDDEIDSFVMSCFFFVQEDMGVKFYAPKTTETTERRQRLLRKTQAFDTPF